MSSTMRFPWTLALVLVLAVGILAWPGWLDASQDDRIESENLDAKSAIIQKRVIAKERVSANLMAGDLTLFEAAAWFGEINDNPACFRSELREVYPGTSKGEQLCRQVIQWVESRALDTLPRSQVKELISRLEADLCEHVEKHGTVVLPKVQ